MKRQLQRHIINISSPVGAIQHGRRAFRAHRKTHGTPIYATGG